MAPSLKIFTTAHTWVDASTISKYAIPFDEINNILKKLLSSNWDEGSYTTCHWINHTIETLSIFQSNTRTKIVHFIINKASILVCCEQTDTQTGEQRYIVYGINYNNNGIDLAYYTNDNNFTELLQYCPAHLTSQFIE